MAEKLIFLGDKATFDVSLGKINALTGLSSNITSTKEANISSNLNLFYDRLDARFRINSDDKFYSDWYDLEDFELDNIKSFSNVFVNSNATTNAEVQFKLLTVPNTWDEDSDYITISNVSITSNAVSSDDTVTESITIDGNVSAIGNDHGLEYQQNFHYNPYDLDEVVKLNDDLSFMATEMYGHEVDYVKVRSNTDKGSDFTLREHNLYNVKEGDTKCLKVVVPSNDFPAPNHYSFSQWGIELPDIFKVHVNHTYFKRIYDEKTIPQERDYLYFRLIDKVFEVSSVEMIRTLNMQPNYWELTLTKWEDRRDIVYEDTETKEEIDDKTESLEELFGDDVTEESDDTLNRDQLRLNDNDLDTVRNYINPALKFNEDNIENYFTLISDSQYNLNSLYTKYENPDLAVTYKDRFSVEKDKATSLTFLAKLDKVKSNSMNCTMVVHSGSTYKITSSVGKFHDGYKVGDMVSVWKKDGYNKVYLNALEITSINNNRDEIFCELYNPNTSITPGDVDLVSATINRDVIVSAKNEYNIETRIRSYTVDALIDRFKVFITEKNAINIEYFGDKYTYILDQKLSDELYYGFVLSFNLRFRMLSVGVYEVLGDPSSSEMPLVQSFTEEEFPNETKISDNILNLVSSPIKLTNIRLFDKHLEGDLHSGYLSRNIIDNAHDVILVDNAELNLKLYNFSRDGGTV